MSKRLPGSQTCCVITRAPRELMFCVLVGSVMNGWLKPANRTGSIAEIRASARASRAGIFSFDDVESDGTVPPALWDGRLLITTALSASYYEHSSLTLSYHWTRLVNKQGNPAFS
jgi:hypothetical protein